MANICETSIEVTLKDSKAAQKMQRALSALAKPDNILELDTPQHVLFDPIITRQGRVVSLCGSTRWAHSDRDFSRNILYLRAQMPGKVDKVAIRYSELGTPVYGVATASGDDDYATDTFVRMDPLLGALVAISAVADQSDVLSWANMERLACAALLKDESCVSERDFQLENQK